jgi:hypothetical protein
MLTPAELLEALDAADGQIRRVGDALRLSVTGPIAPELVIYFQQHKDNLLLSLPGLQEGREALPDAKPSHAPTGDHGRTHEPYIARCSQCGGARWGPIADPVPETLPNGEQELRETWGCLGCAARPEGSRPPPASEPIPPGSVSSACPKCSKPYRLFVPASPHIQGEPDQAVLICGKCGHTELACPECRHPNVVIDSLGVYCINCRRRPGQPEPEPESRSGPPPLPPRRHALGETTPPFDCPACGYRDWRESIYSWACRHCQQSQLKPDGPW